MIATIKEEILKLKKEQDVCIIAHTYQSEDILEIADYIGESYKRRSQSSEPNDSNVRSSFYGRNRKNFGPAKKCYSCQSRGRMSHGRANESGIY